MAQRQARSSDSYYYRAEKLTGNRLSIAARHNKRAILKELGTGGHIDPLRSRLNYSLAGGDTPKAVSKQALVLMQAAGIVKLRKDAVRALELVFSLPVDTALDHQSYFTDCLAWTRKTYGNVPVLAADVHLDEAAPHCHILLLPLIDGKMNGSDLMGGKPILESRRNDFYACVASKYGLTKPPKKQSEGDLTVLYEAVIEYVRTNDPSAVKGVMWAFTRDAIRENPIKAAQLLGLEIRFNTPEKQGKTFVEIMTSKGAGAKTGKPSYNPNRVCNGNMPVKLMNTGDYDFTPFEKISCLPTQNMTPTSADNLYQTLSCVGFTQNSQLSPLATMPELLRLNATGKTKDDDTAASPKHTALPILIQHKAPTGDNMSATGDDFTESATRERESSILATHWNYEGGMFNPPPTKQGVKAQYSRMVSNALDELQQSH